MRVYLCGGINGLSDADAKDWRERAKGRLRNTIDPMRRDYRGREAANVNAIVQGDLHDIDASELVLANCARPSWGTAMEIFYAHTKGIPVVAIVPGDTLSPWLAYHATKLCKSLDEALELIEGWEAVP